MDIMEAIRTRRSTRAFTAEPVAKEIIEQILEAGRVAPSGGNSQTTHFIVIAKPEILQELATLVQTEFAKMELSPNLYKSIQFSIQKSQQGNYVFHYNAPVLIVTANKIGYGNAMADCACAVENMMLVANALDLGSCWINQLHWLDENPAIHAYMTKLGLANDETICAAVAIGKAASSDGLPNRKARIISGNPVTYVS